MSAAFTPGPWQWVGDDEIEQVEHPFASVAEVVGIHRDNDRTQQNANANLIAASPDLYEALARCHALFIGDDTETPIAQLVDSALAKARGEQVPA